MISISLRRVFLAIVAALCLLGAVATPAFAGIATIQRNVYLADPASPGSPAAVVGRDIYLAAGNYSWYVTVRRTGGTIACQANRNIYLASGIYYWYARIGPEGNLYYCDSQLIPKSGPAGYITGASFGAAGGGNFELFGSLRSL